MNKIKVITILGTRPEIIRLSVIMEKLDVYTNHVIVHTNQSFDYEMSQIFFDELNIRKPDYMLDVKADTVGEQIGNILGRCEKVILKEKPDAILILGDTNSALSCIVAKRLKVPVFHIEAGNRCFDERVPEEINRRIIDHTSDINMCYTEHARRNLLREGMDSQDIFVIGSPLNEVYALHQKDIWESEVMGNLSLAKGKFFLASIHREENVDNEVNLRAIIESLCILGLDYRMPVILSTHPHIRKKLSELSIDTGDIVLHKPFGIFDYIKLQYEALCNISDSGTIHEDAAILGIQAINVRESNERPEVYDTGNVIMTGVDINTILSAVAVTRSQKNIKFENPYNDKNCSDKVVRLIMGLHKLVKKRKYHL